MSEGAGVRTGALAQEAAELWLRAQSSPDDAGILASVQAWRAQSAAHDRAFVAAETVWALSGKREAMPPLPPLRMPRSRGTRGVRSRPKVVAVAISGAAAACLAVVTAPSLSVMWQADHRAGTGERRSVTLADGSTVTLDSGSAIAVDGEGVHRGVRLLAGRAWFDVAKDPARPFVVAAADARVTVMGTAFDVDLEDDSVDVALAEGGVRAGWDGGVSSRMSPGERLRFDRGTGAVRRDRMPASAMGSWRRDRLLLEDVPLREAIAQLRRYHRGAIVLADGSIGDRRVTGVFDTRAPIDALRLMAGSHGASVRQITPWLLIVR